MQLKNLLIISIIGLCLISCQNNNTGNGKTSSDSNCTLLTFEELNSLLKNTEKEDYLISENFHKRDEDSTMVYFARCEKEVDETGYWVEMVDLKKDENEFQYTTIENQQYISIKNQVKSKAKRIGKKSSFDVYSIENEIIYGFRVDASKSNKPNQFRVIFSKKGN